MPGEWHGADLRGRSPVVNGYGAGCGERDDRAADGELCNQSAADNAPNARAASALLRPRLTPAVLPMSRSRPFPAHAGTRAPLPPAPPPNRVCRRTMPEDRGREPGAGQHRQHRPERLALGADRELEVAAADAQPQMPAQRPAAKFAAVGHRELFADVLAGRARASRSAIRALRAW